MSRQALELQIRTLRRRVRWLLVERGAFFGAAAGSGLSAVIAALSCRFDVLINYGLWSAVVAAGTAVGAIWGLVRPLDDLALAITTDRRANLRERLSTALVLNRKTVVTHSVLEETASAVIKDAVEHVSKLPANQVFPHKFGLPHALFGIAVLLLAAAVVLPVSPAFQSETRRAEVRVMKQQAAKLTKIAKQISREAPRDQKELRRLAARLQDFALKMQSGRMSKKQAMLKSVHLTKQIKNEQDRLAQANSATKTMRQATMDLRKASDELSKEMAAKLAAEKNIPLSEAMKRLPTDPELARLAKKPNPLTPAEQKALERMLARYADPASGLPIPRELSQAIAKLLENKDYRGALKIIQKLAQRLNLPSNLRKMTEADREALKKQLEALAEALKNTDLDKLAKALLEQARKLAAMSPQELEKLIKELEQLQKMAKYLDMAGAG